MTKTRKTHQLRAPGTDDASLWPDPPAVAVQLVPPTSPVPSDPPKAPLSLEVLAPPMAADGGVISVAPPSSAPPKTGPSLHPHRVAKTLYDLLFKEGLAAVRIAAGCSSFAELERQLIAQFTQNSAETRRRHANYVLRWFFPDGIDGLATSVWQSYQDDQIEADILRYLYLAAEPIVGGCVTNALFPLENGMQIPPEYFDRYLRSYFGGDVPAKTAERLKTSLTKLGFMLRSRGKPDQLVAVAPNKNSLLILVHHLFAPSAPRTVELRQLLANPFWQYLGYKSEDEVRAVLREADMAKLIAKYVVADQLEQITTCFTLQELLARKARL